MPNQNPRPSVRSVMTPERLVLAAFTRGIADLIEIDFHQLLLEYPRIFADTDAQRQVV